MDWATLATSANRSFKSCSYSENIETLRTIGLDQASENMKFD
jgi:hypothetical protein